MTDFVAVRTKLIAELETLEGVEFPAVGGWASSFATKETGACMCVCSRLRALHECR
jgi:hypothetical protein|eukprot:COSAG06_NODE_6000_length_3161_cov_1.870346_3_plen_56_part_00